MINFTNYVRENINNDGILFIVDLQKEFSEFIPENMVDAVIKYCNNFHSVYQIWDSNKADKPSYTFPNQKAAIIKKYGTKFSDDLEKTIKQLNEKYPTAKEGDIFEFDDVDSYVVRVKNNHLWFYIPEAMANIFKQLSGKNVILCGGAAGECLEDVYVAMRSKIFNINANYNKDYCYSAKTSNKQKYNQKTQSKII